MAVLLIFTIQKRVVRLTIIVMKTPRAPDPVSPPDTSLAREVRLRSGTAARLAGLPVTTLRVWERRYGVVAAAKTDSGQRIYSQHDVSRLKLLRRLTHSGHAIGTIARLELEPLRALADGVTLPLADTAVATLSAVVVGRSAAHGLEAMGGCELRAVYDDLDQVDLREPQPGGVDLLLVRLASLQANALHRVLKLAASLHASTTVVVYAFGTESAAQSLRDAGVTVRREPITSRELSHIVFQAANSPRAPRAAQAHVEPRRFSDLALIEIAERPSLVECECLRHMTEIVAQLAGFEQYSRDCTSSSPADAALHAQLSRTAGVARTSFEEALRRMLLREGLPLPLRPADTRA